VFCTDYGLADEFVGICHGVIATIAPGSSVIDLTHSIPRQDVTRGALVLSRATMFMPADAVYCAVVDPGVGSERRALAVLAQTGALLVGPDNGLLSAAWDALGGAVAAHEISAEAVTLQPVSRTFHGRDIFAPAAAHLAAGLALERVGPSVAVSELRTFDLAGPMVAPLAVGARVSGIDGFGNVQLNVTGMHLEAAGIGERLQVSGRKVPIVGIFAELPMHGLGAIVDSQGFLALVVNQGSAADALGLAEGASVVVEAAPEDGRPRGTHLQSVD
jgi:S-adenosylmethionine hydrolase